ncbi:MAG: EAL domain-containing protein [Gammaproteobacteria bacterium]|nr:EAL domain-containing protein [Gammaproteobacteria bacterium]
MNDKKITVLIMSPDKKDKQLFEKQLSEVAHPDHDCLFIDSLETVQDYLSQATIVILRLVTKNENWFDRVVKTAPLLPIILVAGEEDSLQKTSFLEQGAQEYLTQASFFSQRSVWPLLRSATERMKFVATLRSENGEYEQIILAIQNGSVDELIAKDSKSPGKLTFKSKKIIKKLKELVDIDHLTQIPNRLFFDEALQLYIKKAERYKTRFALLIINVDHFKTINDTLGHDIGDELLQLVVARIQSSVRQADMLARLGGDEFALISDHISHFQEAGKIASQILDSLQSVFHLDGKEIHVTVSIGISCYPDLATDASDLLKQVDVALSRAKTMSDVKYQYYEDAFDEEQKRVLEIESSLYPAIQNDEFHLVYQPIIDLQDKKVVHMEALIRWTHADLGPLPPDEFILIAENCGQISVITDWVIHHVCEQITKWQETDGLVVPVAINVSGLDFLHQDIAKKIKAELASFKLEAEMLQVEVTETALMDNYELSEKSMLELRKLGTKVAIDDFGTGHSSLARVYAFPVYALKIDRSFIANLTKNKRSLNIVAAIIVLSKQLGFKVIAEGVETEQELNLLIELGCDYAQGYYFAKPLPVDEVMKFRL